MRIISKSIADSQFFSRSFVKYVVHLLFDAVVLLFYIVTGYSWHPQEILRVSAEALADI